MGNINAQINEFLSQLSGDDSTVKIRMRTQQVYDEYKQAMRWVYKDYSAVFLQHTNAVYITKQDELVKLIVYVDESIFAADLNAQREMVKGWINSTFNEHIDEFEIHISRGNYRNFHPFESSIEEQGPITVRELQEDEKNRIDEVCEHVENAKVRTSLKKAMTADFKRH